jgi:hypothetical protein
MQINVAVTDSNNIVCEVVPPQTQVITIDRGVAGNGIVSIVPVTISTFQYLRITYTNGTVQDVGPLTSTAYTATAPITIVGNTISLATVPIASGGTDATTAADAIKNLLPSYTGNGGKRLGLNSGATALEWVLDGGGTVTSIAASGGTTGLTFSGSPITTSGTLTLGGTLAIASGGTGATTAADALTNLGAIGAITSTDGSVTITSTGTSRDLSVAVAAATTNVIAQVRNTTGATLTKGTVVYISGATGQISTVSKALATSDATSAQTLGMMTADLANNSNGNVTIIGLITNIDTSAYTSGQQLYLSGTTAGAVTATKPYAPIHLVYVAVVEYAHPTQGKLFVKVQNGYELDEIHDVSAQTPSNGQTIVYNSSNSLWENNTVSLTIGVNGILPVLNGGTGQTTTQAAMNSFAGAVTSGSYLRGNGTNVVMSTIQAADVPTLNQNTTGTAANVTGVVAIANGGTGQTTANAALNALLPTQTGNASKYLQTDGTNATWDAISLSTADITGILPTANGGTGLSSFTANGVVYASSTSALTTGSALTFDGTNLGVGATTLNYKLEIGSTSDSTNSINIKTSATGTSNLFFSDTNNGQGGINYNHTSDYMRFLVADAERLRIDSAGTVFVNTTSRPSGIGGGDNGKLWVKQTTTGNYGISSIASATDSFISIANNGTVGLIGTSYGSTGSYLPLAFYTSDLERARIDNSGNFGLGVTPSAWASSKAIQIGSTYSLAMSAFGDDSNITTNAFYNSSGNWVYQNTASTYKPTRYNQFLGNHIWSVASATGTAGSTITWSESARINSSGNFGIGTSSPSTALYVKRTSGNSGIYTDYNGTNVGRIEAASNGNLYIGITTGSGDLSIGNTANANAIQLLSSGNLGLGVTPNAWQTTSYKVLQIGATTSIFNDGGAYTQYINNAYIDSAYAWRYQTTSFATRQDTYNGQHRWFNAPSGTAFNVLSWTQAMTLDADGDLILGTTSTAAAEGYRFYKNYGRYDNGTFVGFIGGGTSLGSTAASDFVVRSENALSLGSGGFPDRIRITSTGDVGIGTTSPAAKLDVNGNISLSGAGTGTRYLALLSETSTYAGTLNIQAGGGSAGFGGGVSMYGHSHASYPGAVWIGYSGGTSTGILFGSGGNGVGAETMRLNTTGLGIGTSSPNYSLTSYKGGAVANYIQVASGATGAGSGNGLLLGVDSSGNSVINAQGSGSGNMLFYTATTEKMRIDTSGNLLLGLSSALTNGKLQIAGGIGLSGNTQIRQATNGDGNTLQLFATQVVVGVNNGTSYSYTGGGLLASLANSASAITLDVGGTTAGHRLQVVNDGSGSSGTLNYSNAGTSRFYVNSSTGFVGIGTSTVAAKLEVYDAGTFNARTSGINVHRPGSYGQYGSFAYDSNAVFFSSTYSGAGAGSYGQFIFQAYDSTSTAAERARIDASGNFLVGTTTAGNRVSNHLFQVGPSGGGGQINISSGYTADSALNVRDLGGNLVSFFSGATRVGVITTNGTNTTYGTSSDYRLKNSVTRMTGAIAKVSALKPVTYKWNADGSDGQGFIAHELAEVCPDAVTGKKDGVDENGNPKYQGIDTSFLVATLTAAIQEQQAIIESLKARLDAANL